MDPNYDSGATIFPNSPRLLFCFFAMLVASHLHLRWSSSVDTWPVGQGVAIGIEVLRVLFSTLDIWLLLHSYLWINLSLSIIVWVCWKHVYSYEDFLWLLFIFSSRGGYFCIAGPRDFFARARFLSCVAVPLVLVLKFETMSNGPACVRHIFREWKNCPSCRSNMVDHKKLVVSHEGPEIGVKSCIKDAVRNKFCLIPLLQQISQRANWKLFTLKDVQAELLVFATNIFLFWSSLVGFSGVYVAIKFVFFGCKNDKNVGYLWHLCCDQCPNHPMASGFDCSGTICICLLTNAESKLTLGMWNPYAPLWRWKLPSGLRLETLVLKLVWMEKRKPTSREWVHDILN